MVSVSIVTYKNSFEEVKNVVEDVLRNNVCKIFIIDNSPTDELSIISLFSEKIDYRFSQDNIGYGSGHNIAIIESIKQNFTYHLVLNPDIKFEANILNKIKEFMDETIEIGLLMPKVLNPDGSVRRIRRLLPSLYNIFGKYIFSFLSYSKYRDNLYRTNFLSYDKAGSFPFLSGCFMFFRISELKKVGLFDERFFMYFEDVDLSRRFYMESISYYYPEVSIIHIANQESHKNFSLFKIHIKSALKYFNKWGWFFDRDSRIVNHEIISKYR